MTASETAQFRITLDAKEAEAGLESLRGKSETMGGGLENINKRLEHFDSGVRESSKVIRGMQGAMGDSHSAALEMLNVAGDLAGAFASGGVVNVAMAAGTFVIGQLTKAWSADKAEAKAWSDFIKNTTTNNVKVLLQSIHDLGIELDNFGKSARERQVAEAQAFVDDSTKYKKFYEDDIEKRQEQIAARRHLLELDISPARSRQLKSEIDQQEKLIEGSQSKLRAQGSDIELGKVKLDQLKQLELREDLITQAEERRKLAVAAAKDAANDQVGPVDVNNDADWIKKLEDADKLRAAAEHERLKKQRDDIQAALDDEVDAHNKAEKEMTKITLEEDKKRNEENAKATEEQSKMLEQAYGAGFDALLGGASQSLFGFFQATKDGQKDAAQAATAQFLKSTGEQLVGLGLKNVLEGTGMLLTGNPAGAGLAGIGAAELALGASMGAVGVAISPAAAGSSSAASRATTDQGVNRGAGGGGGGGSRSSAPATTIINVTYGAAGPAPQDTGRAVVDALKAFQRSSGITVAPRQQGPSR